MCPIVMLPTVLQEVCWMEAVDERLLKHVIPKFQPEWTASEVGIPSLCGQTSGVTE